MHCAGALNLYALHKTQKVENSCCCVWREFDKIEARGFFFILHILVEISSDKKIDSAGVTTPQHFGSRKIIEAVLVALVVAAGFVYVFFIRVPAPPPLIGVQVSDEVKSASGVITAVREGEVDVALSLRGDATSTVSRTVMLTADTQLRKLVTRQDGNVAIEPMEQAELAEGQQADINAAVDIAKHEKLPALFLLVSEP